MMVIAGGRYERAMRSSCSVFVSAFLLLSCLLFTNASAEGGSALLGADQVPSLATCKESFEKFLMTVNVASQMANPDLMACVGSATEGCCRAIDSFVGTASPIFGCSCHKELHSDAWDTVRELAPIVSPGSNLAYIPVARPIVMQRIKDCNIPTPDNGLCPDLTSPSGGEEADHDHEASATSIVGIIPADPASGAQGSTIVIPDLNRTSAMMEYSAAYERTLEGFDEYGWYNPCTKLAGAKYCLANLQAPNNFMQVRYGMCVPEASEEEAIARAIADTSPEHYDRHKPHVDCSVMEKTPLGVGGIVTASIFALILCAVIVSTLIKLLVPLQPDGACARTVQCFDFCQNWHQLMAKPKMGMELDLTTLNGLRAVSMFWVILGHTLSYIIWIGGIAYPGRLITPNNLNMVLKQWFISIYAGGFFAVDTFFFISGLLVAFVVSREIVKRRSRKTTLKSEMLFWLVYVVNRFVRLLPTFAAVLFFFWKIAPSLSSSPIWKLNWDQHSRDCEKYWWSDLFFLNNFIPVGNPSDGLAPTTCVGGTWYLAVDMQLYIFVAPVVIAAWHHGFYLKGLLPFRKAASVGVGVAMIVLSIALAAYTTIERDVWLQYFGEGNFYYYYVKPWIRAPPYLLGLLLGLLFHDFTNDKKGKQRMEYLRLRISSWVPVVLFGFSMTILALLVFPISTYYNTDHAIPPITTTHSAGWSRDSVIVYNTFKFFAWGLALFLLVLPTCLGRLRLVTEILGGHIWAPLAKLTYGAYLIHMLYPQALLTSTDATTFYYHTSHTLGMWLVFTIGSYFWSAILYMVVEAPFGNLQKLIFSGGRQTTDKPRAVKRKLTDLQPIKEFASPRMPGIVISEESIHQRSNTPRASRIELPKHSTNPQEAK
jgi:peptidoglycan/LPS O-acetylase OafA/YrhL